MEDQELSRNANWVLGATAAGTNFCTDPCSLPGSSRGSGVILQRNVFFQHDILIMTAITAHRSDLPIFRHGLELFQHGQQLRVLEIVDQQARSCIAERLPRVPSRQTDHRHAGSHTSSDPWCRVLDKTNQMNNEFLWCISTTTSI